MKQIIPGVYTFTGLMVGRVYLIEDGDGLTLIDTGIAQAGPKILAQVGMLGRAPSDIKRILITHAHPDHAGSLPGLRQATGAQIFASTEERPVIEGKIPIPRVPRHQLRGMARLIHMPNARLPGTPVDRVVNGGDVLADVMGGLHVVATPGHAPGHIAFWQPEKGILFCGDAICRTPNLRLPYSFLTYDMDENKRSIRRLAELDASIVCFGHGQPLTERAAQAIRAFARTVGAM